MSAKKELIAYVCGTLSAMNASKDAQAEMREFLNKMMVEVVIETLDDYEKRVLAELRK